MKFIIGKKLEMSQRYRPDGEVVPVTVVRVEPCVVTQVKSVDTDGYSAVQIGSGRKKRLAKPELGQRRGFGPLAVLREFRVEDPSSIRVGARCDASVFRPGDEVKATGVSKGKGFQGVVKRHGFRGSPATHGHKDQLRMPGSIGAGGVQRVFKGMRMAGRMGGKQVTVSNLEIVAVEGDLLSIKGALPGPRGSWVFIYGPGEMTFQSSEDREQSSEDREQSSEDREQSSGEREQSSGERERVSETEPRILNPAA
jgi:large subunit ribosomal protein L3